MITVRARDVEVRRYPDGQTNVPHLYLPVGAAVRLVWPIRSNDELVILLQISNALDGLWASKEELVIPYLMGARTDRRMEPGGSVDLKVVADCVNRCGFSRVHLFDVHSDVALQLIERSKNHDNRRLVSAYSRENAVLICPDAGAAKKIGSYQQWNPLITDVTHCAKVRNAKTGEVSLRVLEPELCRGRNCVIIDDICDGGATFEAIADRVPDPLSMTLIVSHGIFSKGTETLLRKFDRIITSDSFASRPSGGRLEVIELGL